MASFLEARKHGGAWLIRIDDIDPQREVPGSAESILRDLERLGLKSDEAILFQSTRTQTYRHVLEGLIASGDAYWCGCSRSDIPVSGVYPGTCREGLPAGRKPRSVRLNIDGVIALLEDRIQGRIEEALANTSGDFVIWRADGFPAYQLAVVVDDAYQRITEIVRGADLLDSTLRQICLQQKLKLATPAYAHVPMVVDPSGDKLSKRRMADPVTSRNPAKALEVSLRLLGQQPPTGRSLPELWDWALANWAIENVPRQRECEFKETT